MKDVVIFVNAIRPATFKALEKHWRDTGELFTPIVLVDESIRSVIEHRNSQHQHLRSLTRISADFNSPGSVAQALAPYRDRIFAVTSQYENSIHELQKLIPLLPYLELPTETSLTWATEKLHMRRLFEAYDPALVPPYINVHDASETTIRRIERDLDYPVVVKPSGLEGSLLVSLASDAHELRAALAHTASEMKSAYAKWIKRQQPTIVVEEYMEGDMYSIDTYVSAAGACRHTPPVKVITGRQVGFDDFFGYMRVVPTGLDINDIAAAETAAAAACHALGLRSVTAHVELMRTSAGWKIIELGPRIGGYRQELYSAAYGINHIVNDILNRGGREPVIPRKLLAPTALLNIYAREEGILHSIDGLDEIKALPSFQWAAQGYQIGQPVKFAKNNGDPVFDLFVSHPQPGQLEKDISSIEQQLRLGVRVLQPAG